MSRKTIFLVDDDMTNLTIGKTAIGGTYNVFTLNSGAKLIKMLEKAIPDLILLDVEMPEMNGYEAIKIIKNKKETADVPVIFLTAKSDGESELEGLSLGAIDYIIKSGCKAPSPAPWHPGEPLNKDMLKIGVIHVDDAASGYSYEHDKGIVQVQREIGLHDEQIIRKLNVHEADVTMVESMMRDCIKEGANVIVAISWEYMDACEKLAAEYPNVIFANASGYKYNDTNFTNYFGRIYQARYLSGIAAGLRAYSKSF